MTMIPNGDTISVFKYEDGPVSGEGLGTVALLKFLDKDLWSKQAHLDIWKEVPFTL